MMGPKKEEGAKAPADDDLSKTAQSAEVMEAKPSDVLELVACRQKLKRTRQATRDMQESNRSLRDALAQHKFEQSEIFAYLNKVHTLQSHTCPALPPFLST